MDISNKKIIVATHYLVYGAPQALREYLMIQKVSKLLFIAHPLQVDETKSYYELIEKGKTKNKTETKFRSKISVLNYFIEMLLSLKWILFSKTKFDLYVGVDSLNAIIGIFLKKLGIVNKVVYYTIDYVPIRFNNKFLNNIYHGLDRLCVKYSDETWNVSYRIAEGRKNIRGMDPVKFPNQKIVPIGVWMDRIIRKDFSKIKKHQLLFVGNLLEKQGVQLVLDAIKDVIKQIPDFHFLIVGGGEYEPVLRQKVIDLDISNYVTFTGWIKDRSQLDVLMQDSAISIAMYDKQKDTFTYYADPTKLKDYLSVGLPILLTDLPHNAIEIQQNGCGIIIDYDKHQVANGIISLLKDEKQLEIYRENCIRYSNGFDWNNIFGTNLERILR